MLGYLALEKRMLILSRKQMDINCKAYYLSIWKLSVRPRQCFGEMLPPLLVQVKTEFGGTCGWRIVISLTVGNVTLLHSVAELARIELLVADFEGIRAT